jgi:hypothetical protein
MGGFVRSKRRSRFGEDPFGQQTFLPGEDGDSGNDSNNVGALAGNVA